MVTHVIERLKDQGNTEKPQNNCPVEMLYFQFSPGNNKLF